MDFISKINKLERHKALFLLFLLLVAFITRLPTLFNDYYDVDELAAIVQTHEYMGGGIPGKDFKESKLPLYHAVFKGAYSISPENGWVFVHIFTIIIVYCTAIFIYLAGKKINGFATGAMASFFYAGFVSSFNRHFMATNGEIVYNLPTAAGLFFFIIFLSNKDRKKSERFLFLALSICMGACAAYIKFHGIIFFIYLAFFLIIYTPYYKNKFTVKYLSLLSFIFVLVVAILTFDYFYSHRFAHAFISKTAGNLTYASVKGFNPVIFLGKYVHRQIMLNLWHFAVWAPAIVFIHQFIKRKFKADSIELSAVAILFIFTYLMIFAGGSRLYFHYFLAAYPALCIIGAFSLNTVNINLSKKVRTHFSILILLPCIFFLIWNIKDIVIRNYYPQAFYKEGKILYWARAVLVGTFNDYLLPASSYKDACEYIKKISNKNDRIFVWGDGPYLYYFAQRRMGIFHVWPKTAIFIITGLYEKGDYESINAAKDMESGFIDTLQKKKPVLFIDTSENGLSNFHYKLTPLVKEYVETHYYFIKEVNNIKIFKRKIQ